MQPSYISEMPGMPQPMMQQGMPQGQMPTSSDELYAKQIQQENTQNLISQISPDHQLLELQWRIKGYVKNVETGLWEKLDKKAPEPSPLLVGRYISYLSSILNQNTTLSNLSGAEINAIMKLVIEWLADDLDANAEEYGFRYDYSERTRIGQLMLNNTFLVLKRAQNGMESRRIFKTLNVSENLNDNQSGNSSWTDALKFWKN